ncbi:MAG TPA: ATP-binding protein [Bacteroidota bacterium]|nr:ATP-binding protein [Bacteroidota bacterium]
MRIRTKLTLVLLSVSVLVLSSAGIFTALSVGHFLRARVVGELKTESEQINFLLRSPLSPHTGTYEILRSYARSGNNRVTLVARDGTVIFDSDIREGDLGRVENHAGRPEIAEALRGRIGTSTRHSATIGQDLLYLARPVIPPLDTAGQFGSAAVIRLSIPLTQVDSAITEIRTNIILVSAAIFGGVVILIGFMARRLSGPLAEMAAVAGHIRAGELDRRITVRSDDELGKLGDTLNGMIDKLNQDIAQLRKLERVRTEFLGNVSHELRTPIFAIQGMLETLIDGAVDDPEVNRDFLRRALHNTKNLSALLNDLIEISRIESGDMKMSFRYFDVGEFLRGVVSEMSPIAERRSVRISVETLHADQEVYGDRERLKQVLVNLVDNAVKYNRESGSVRIVVAPAGEGVRISVADEGIGIPSEHLGRIFERFYRVDKERSREAGGTGLGLAIVKHIVEAHGSAVSVESSPGTGTVFSFTLKIAG